MKLYLVQEKYYVSDTFGFPVEILKLQGIYRDKQVAEKAMCRVNNAVITEIDTDLFEG